MLVPYTPRPESFPTLPSTPKKITPVAEFADAIAKKRKPLTGAVSGIHVVSLLEAAERSLRSEGRRVHL